jgi:hypothetical protein
VTSASLAGRQVLCRRLSLLTWLQSHHKAATGVAGLSWLEAREQNLHRGMDWRLCLTMKEDGY